MTANAAELAIEDTNNQTAPSNIIKSLQTLTSNIAEGPVGGTDSHHSHNEESQKGNARPKANRGKRGRKKKVPPKPCQHPILPKMFAIQITPQPSVLASMGTFINQALLPSPAKLPLPSTSQPPTNSVVTSPKTAEVSNNKVSSTTTATSTRKKARASRSRKKSVKESIALAGKFHYASHDSEPTAFQSEDIILSGGFPQQNHRRIVHNATEKRRKEKINGWINKIATVLFKYNPEQKHKIYILEKAYEFISERSTNNLEEGKSQDAFTQSASTEQPGFPELVKKIAELENLVDALLTVIKKHKIPTQPNLMLSSYARSKLESFGIPDAGNDSHDKDLTCPIGENSNTSTNVAISTALSDFVAEMTRHENLDPSPTSVPPPTTNSIQNTPECVATSESFVLVSKAQQQHLADASQLTSIDRVSQLAQDLPTFSANVQLETLNRNHIETTVQKPIRTARQSSADMISTIVTPVAAPVTSLSVSENTSDLQKLTATTVQFSLNVPSAVQASHAPPAVSLNELALPGNTGAYALCKPHANLMPTVEPSLVAPVISLHQLPSTDIFQSSSQKQLAPSTNFVANIVPTPETPLVAPMTLQQNASIDQDLQLVISVENTLLNTSYLNSNTASTPENGVFTNLQIAPKSTDIQLTSNQISPSFSLYSTASKKTQAITAKSSAPAVKRSLNGSMPLVALTSTKSCPASIPSIPYNLHDMSLVSSNATCADYIGQNTHSGPNSQPGLKTHSDPNSLSSPNNQSGPNNHSGTSSHSASLVINKVNVKSSKKSNASKAPTMKSQMFVMKNMVQSRSKPINLDASFDSYFSSTSFDSLVNSAMSSDSIQSLTSTRDIHSMPVASVLASGAERHFDTNTKTDKACNERTSKPQKTLPTIPGSSSPTLTLQTSTSMDQDLQPASMHQRSSNPSRPSQPSNASNKFIEFAKSLASSQSLQNMPNLLESGNLAQQSGQNLKRKRAPPKSSVHLQNRHSVTNLLSDACSTENNLSSVSDILTRTSDGFPVNDANAGVTGKSQVMNSSQPLPMTTLSENSSRARVTSSISRKRHHNTTEGNDSTKSSENSQSINTSKMPQKRQKRAVTQRNASTPKSSHLTATSIAQGSSSNSRNKNYRVSEGKRKARPESPLPSSIKGDSSLPRPHSIVSLARDKPPRTEENNRRKSEFSAESLLRNNSFPNQQQQQHQLKQQQQQQQQHQQQQQQLQQQQQPHNQQQHHQQLHNHQQYQQKQNQHHHQQQQQNQQKQHQQQQQNQQKQHQQQQMNQQQQQQHHHHQQQQLNLLQNPHSNSHQDGNLPTILNIFAPASIGSMINPAASLGNMSNFSNFQNQATAPIVNISLPTIQSSFSNFSAEALIGGPVDTQQGASNTLNPVHNVHDNMLVPQENHNLFTDFSADTLLAGTESSLSYGIDNIMNRNESSISSSCISPNWLQAAPLIDSSPVRSSFNPGFNMFESTTGSQVHKSAPTNTNFILPGKWRPDFNKGDESNVNNGNFSIAGGTNVSMWGSGGLSGQQKPQQNQPSRPRQKTAVKVQQSSKRGPSYGDFLLVDSTS